MVVQQTVATQALLRQGGADDVAAVRAEGAVPILVPQGGFLLSAQFVRMGSDLLLTGADGRKLLVLGYFDQPHPPALVTESGAEIAGDLAERLAGPATPGAYAQAGAGAPRPSIGAVEALAGDATAMRTDGTRVPLAVGAPVFQGDVVETAPGSRLAIVFVDKTSFTLDSATRMVLDELVFDPGAGGRSAFSLVQGTFVYISGEVAKIAPQNVQIRTPVATVGIRGTEIGFVVLGPGDAGGASFTVLDGQIAVQNAGGTQILGAGFVTTVASSLVAPGAPFAAPPSNIAAQYGALRGYGANAIINSTVRQQQQQQQQQQLLPPPAPGRGEGPVTGGMRAASGEVGSNPDQVVQGNDPQNLAGIAPGAGPGGGPVLGALAATGSIFGPSAAIKGPVALTTAGLVLSTTAFAVSNQPSGADHSRTGGDAADHRVTQTATTPTAPAATPPAATQAVPDQVSASAAGGATQIFVLTNDTKPANVPALTIVAIDTTGTQGTVTVSADGMTLSYEPGAAFQSLGEGQTATDTFNYTISDGAGTFSTATVSVVVSGVNDVPVITANSGADSVALSVVEGSTAVTTVTAVDPDTGTSLTYTLSGADAGAFTIDASGNLVFAAPPDYANPIDAGADNVYNVTVTASDGSLTDSQDFAITVTANPGADPDDFDSLGLPGSQNLAGTDTGDSVYGGSGNDTIDGSTTTGNDTFYGGSGDDLLISSDGSDDALFGGSGNDTLLGGNGADQMVGGTGNDLLVGGASGDNMAGNAGNDTLMGGSGSDFLDGGAGADVLDGGDAGDILQGGTGADVLTGGAGQDIFYFASPADGAAVGSNITAAAAGATPDVITDFVSGEDQILLDGTTFDPSAQLVIIAGAYDGNLGGSGPALVLDGAGNLNYDADTSTPGYTVVAHFDPGTTVAPSDIQFTPSGI